MRMIGMLHESQESNCNHQYAGMWKKQWHCASVGNVVQKKCWQLQTTTAGLLMNLTVRFCIISTLLMLVLVCGSQTDYWLYKCGPITGLVDTTTAAITQLAISIQHVVSTVSNYCHYPVH